MSVSIATLKMHLNYHEWAGARLLDAAAQLSDEELDRDFGTADKSVVGTLGHVFAADRIWFERVQGAVKSTRLDDFERTLAYLRVEWPAVLERWKEWGAALTEEGALRELSYVDLKGNAWKSPLWQVVLHVVNHGTHHRGAVSGFLRSMGKTPPVLDLMAYYRAQGATAAGR